MDRALSRRKFVLDQMREKGFITPAYYEDLVKAPAPVIAAVCRSKRRLRRLDGFAPR